MRLVIMMTALLALTAQACDRVRGQEDGRRANAGCVILKDNLVLLLTHRFGGKLGVPGGTREGDELAQCTAYRETREESGLSVQVGRRLQVMKNGFHLYRCYPAFLPATLPVPASGLLEVKALGWYRLDELRREDWRFSYQFGLFVDTVRRELGEEKSGDLQGRVCSTCMSFQ